MKHWQQSLLAIADRCLDEVNKDHRLALVLASMSVSKHEEIPGMLNWVQGEVEACKHFYAAQWGMFDNRPAHEWGLQSYKEGALHLFGTADAIRAFQRIAIAARRIIPFEFHGRPSLFPFLGDVSVQQYPLQQFAEFLYVSPINMAILYVDGSKRLAYTRPMDDLFQLCFDAFQVVCDQDVNGTMGIYQQNFATLWNRLENPVPVLESDDEAARYHAGLRELGMTKPNLTASKPRRGRKRSDPTQPEVKNENKLYTDWKVSGLLQKEFLNGRNIPEKEGLAIFDRARKRVNRASGQ